MRIGLIVPGGVDPSGRERVVPVFLNLIQRLARRHSVCVFALRQGPTYERYELRGATVVNIGRTAVIPRGLRSVDRFLGLLHNIFRERPRFDVLHAYFASEPGMMAAAAGKLLGIPVVSSALGGEFVALHDISYGDQRSHLTRAIVNFALRHSQIMTAPSRHAAAQCQRSDTHCVPMGVDRTVFSPAEQPPTAPPWRLVHVASLNRVKDQGTLLRAVRRTIDRGCDVQLEIVGEDTVSGTIQRLAAELNLRDRVRFRGFVANEDLPAIYRRAHLYVHSSRHEGMPVSALEAAACGVPLVGTSVGLFHDLAPDAAIAVEPGNPDALADGIIFALSDESLRRRMVTNALQFAHDHDADWMASQFECLYRRAAFAASPEEISDEPSAYSSRKATIGSTCEARRAGKTAAANATAHSNAADATYTSQSSDLVP